MRTEEMLAFYAEQFDTVEVNNSFYRMPQLAAIEKWRDTVPDEFRFAYKAYRGIVHRKHFADDTEMLDRFAELLRPVGQRLGPVLFQFETIADIEQLATFLGNAKKRFERVVVEFRHRSWLTDATYNVLRQTDVAMCQTETDEECTPLLEASDFAYLRLRKTNYSEAELKAWKAKFEGSVAGGRDVYCFFMHEDEARGPQFVLQVMHG
jgi:uncharacterized protein YecE (DUF72 family)